MSDVTISAGPVFGRRDPDARGYFGAFGGRFVPETLVEPVERLTAEYLAARRDPGFVDELNSLFRSFVGRRAVVSNFRRYFFWSNDGAPTNFRRTEYRSKSSK